MRTTTHFSFTIKQIFILSLMFYALLWASLPIWIRHCLPLDVMEGTTWAHHWQWGYDKDPYLNALLTRFALWVGQGSDVVLYGFSQLMIGLAAISLWRLFTRMFSPTMALFSIAALASCQYYNIASVDFNDNVVLIALWAIAIERFHAALVLGQLWRWLGLGVVCGLGLMAKYSFVFLLLSFLVFYCLPVVRKQRPRIGVLLLAILAGILVCLPHIIWLWHNDLVTIRYVIYRGRSHHGLLSHFYFPLKFLLNQIVTFLPVMVVVLLSLKSVKIKRPLKLPPLDKQFLWWVGLLPMLLLALFSFVFAAELHQMWAMPMLLLWSAILTIQCGKQITMPHVKRMLCLVLLVNVLMATGYVVSLRHAGAESTANYPGKDIAMTLTQAWHTQFQQPLRYVAGSRYEAGVVAHYSVDRPTVFIDWNHAESQWIDLADFRRSGAWFVWRPKEYGYVDILCQLTLQFPRMRPPVWRQMPAHGSPDADAVYLWIALLPPNKELVKAK